MIASTSPSPELLSKLSQDLIKNVEGRLHTDAYDEKRILDACQSKEEAMKKIKSCRRLGLKSKSLRFNFDMCHFLYYEIASYLELSDWFALTSTCRKANDLLHGYRIQQDRYNPGTYTWMQRCRILLSNSMNHAILGGVHERHSPISASVTCTVMNCKYMVLAGYDGNISIWEFPSSFIELNVKTDTWDIFPTCRKIIKAHDGWCLHMINISPSLIATAGADGSVKIWCIESILDATKSNNIINIKETVLTEPMPKVVESCFLRLFKCFDFMFRWQKKDILPLPAPIPMETVSNRSLYNGVTTEKLHPVATITTSSKPVIGMSCRCNSLFVSCEDGWTSEFKMESSGISSDDDNCNRSSLEGYGQFRITTKCSLTLVSPSASINNKRQRGNFQLKSLTTLTGGEVVGISDFGRQINFLQDNKWVTLFPKQSSNHIGRSGKFKLLCPLPSGELLVTEDSSTTTSLIHFRKSKSNAKELDPDYGRHERVSKLISCLLALDDRYIIIGCINRSLVLFDILLGSEVGAIQNAHSGTVTTLIYLPESRCIASGGIDGSIRLTKLHVFGLIELEGDLYPNRHFFDYCIDPRRNHQQSSIFTSSLSH